MGNHHVFLFLCISMYFYAFLCVPVFLVSTWDVVVGYVDMLTLEPIRRYFFGGCFGQMDIDIRNHQNFHDFP